MHSENMQRQSLMVEINPQGIVWMNVYILLISFFKVQYKLLHNISYCRAMKNAALFQESDNAVCSPPWKWEIHKRTVIVTFYDSF